MPTTVVMKWMQYHWRNRGGGARGRSAPPGKLNVKTGPSLADILIFIRGVFVFLANIGIHDIWVDYHFLAFFWVLASGPPTMTNGPPPVEFCSPWLKPLATPLCKASSNAATMPPTMTVSYLWVLRLGLAKEKCHIFGTTQNHREPPRQSNSCMKLHFSKLPLRRQA